MSLEYMLDAIKGTLKEKEIPVISQNYQGEGYEMTVAISDDIDYPTYYTIKIEKEN